MDLVAGETEDIAIEVFRGDIEVSNDLLDPAKFLLLREGELVVDDSGKGLSEECGKVRAMIFQRAKVERGVEVIDVEVEGDSLG